MAKNKLRVDTGAVTVEVNDQGDELSFVVDVIFAEKFQDLYGEIEQKSAEFEERRKALMAEDTQDENGIHANERERTALVKEVCLYFQEKIDSLFGEDACKKALGGAMRPDLYLELLEGLTPFIKNFRKEKTNKYAK